MLEAQRVRSRRRLAVSLAALGFSLVAVLAFALGSSSAGTSVEPRALGKRDAHFWQQLLQGFKPAKSMGLNSMADHEMLVLPSGLVLALHFDNMNLAKARHLNWIAVGVPGVFTQADQRRVNRLYGPGFTHFHDLKTDLHGGKRGVKGVWFVHIGARSFTSPFGKVSPGKADLKFMPTKAPR
jgi:hypothetical protein